MILAIALAFASAAQAATWGSFDAAAYAAARKADRVVLLQFIERGCTACEEQERILSRLFWGSSRTDWVGFRVDLVRDAEVAKALGVTGRSTLVLFRGAREIGRSVGAIQRAELTGFLNQADIPEPRGRAPARPKNRRPPRP